jgi:hypothetical protein
MNDVRSSLKSASRLVTVPDRSFDRLLERRDRTRHRQRLASFVVALVVGAGSVGGAALLLTGLREDSDDAVGTGWQPEQDLTLGPTDYFYLKVESSDLGDGHVRDEETWWAIDGSGEVRNRSTRQDKYPYPPNGTYADGGFPVRIPNVPSLSTDPATLVAQFSEEPWIGLNGPEPDPLWDFVGPLLLETPHATPELRAALYEVARGIDGVTVSENDTDPVGRSAIGLSFSDPEGGVTWTTYFDAGTHQAIAWAYRSDWGGEGWQVLESGIVDAMGVRPASEQWLVPPIPPGTP